MNGQNIDFGNKKNAKSNFYKHKKTIQDRWHWCWKNISFQKQSHMAQISQLNISLDKMTVISIKLLCIKVPQMTGYVKCFDSNNKKS